MPLDANCILPIPSINNIVIKLSVYKHIFIHRWCLYCNIGAVDCADCIWKSYGCCKSPYDVGLFIVSVRKLDASGWHPNYTVPHGWYNITQDRWGTSYGKALVKSPKVSSNCKCTGIAWLDFTGHLFLYPKQCTFMILSYNVSSLYYVLLCIPASHAVLRIRSITISTRTRTKLLLKIIEWMNVASS